MDEIRKVQVSGFKTLRECELDLQPLNLLIGPNGAGKSNLMSLFGLLYDAMDAHLQVHVAQQGGADSLLHEGSKRTGKMNLRFEFSVEHMHSAYTVELEVAAGDSLAVASERLGYQLGLGMSKQELALGGGRKELLLALHGKGDDDLAHLLQGAQADPAFFLRTLAARSGVPPVILAAGQADGNLLAQAQFAVARGYSVEDFFRALARTADTIKAICQTFRVYHFNDTSPSAAIKRQGDINDNRFLRPDGGNLAAFLYRLRSNHPAHYEKIRDTIRLAAPFFDDFRLAPLVLNAQRLLLEWKDRFSDRYFNASHLPDGLLRFMCLATLLLQPDPPPLIMIDEPELGLHPYAVGVLSGLLRGASTRSQLLVATHSVLLLDDVDDVSAVVICERTQGESVFHRADPDTLQPWLEDYSLSEIWQKNVPGFGGRPRS